MDKEKQSIHYCTILSDEQWNFILEGRFSAQRQRCLHRLMTHAVRTKTVCNIKGIEIALEVGEVAASDVELAEYLKCNRIAVITAQPPGRVAAAISPRARVTGSCGGCETSSSRVDMAQYSKRE